MSFYNYKAKLWSFMVNKMFIEIRLCNPMTYIFKGHVKIIQIYMVEFNVSTLNRLQVMGFFVNTKYIHKHIIFNIIVTKLVTIWQNVFYFHIWTVQATLTILTGKNCILFNLLISVQEWLLVCFWAVSYTYTINEVL